jgi:hypothetical protein
MSKSTDGAIANTVRTMMMRTDVEGSFSPLMLTLTFDPAAISTRIIAGPPRALGSPAACALPLGVSGHGSNAGQSSPADGP